MRARRAVAFAVALTAAVAVPATAASAHPLGNFTVNQYSGLRVEPAKVTVDYVVDMAEIPTFQARRDLAAQGAPAWAAAQCGRLMSGLDVAVAGHRVALSAGATSITLPPGAGGLSTLRLECSFAGATAAARGTTSLTFRNRNFGDRVGWREVTAAGVGTTLARSDVPTTSVSHRLTAYPQDLLQSPPDVRGATVAFRPGPGAGAGVADGGAVPTAARPLGAADRATRAFTRLVERHHLSVGFLLIALLVSAVLGAFHAVAPGHGKTVMAAYLVGERGTLRQAALIGATVTATHTAGVLLLGLLVTASKVIAPERLYPWLGVASGLLFAWIGTSLFLRVLRARAGARTPRPPSRHHEHEHEHEHEHHDHEHEHEHGRHSHGGVAHSHDEPIRWRSLVTLGLAGGITPSPSAIVVLLAATALGRAWFGVILVTFYGLGMAATLTIAGLVLVRARGAFDRNAARWRGTATGRLAAAVPLATAVVIVVVGVALAARGAAQI